MCYLRKLELIINWADIDDLIVWSGTQCRQPGTHVIQIIIMRI